MQGKAGKDSQQAGEMIELLLQDRPGDMELAVDSLNRRGEGWSRKLRAGLQRLPGTPDEAKQKTSELLA
jgi:hypothetical protein